ncbi:D-sedoheptulose-7-phosphate isomerase [Parafrigoribacterium soli]|uniref:D-sedoheptulose-7-phosphate isomerase n=1 Tax=Parafrigoribacterium soli TaxID=3144663 RepID=UPI0032EE4391
MSIRELSTPTTRQTPTGQASVCLSHIESLAPVLAALGDATPIIDRWGRELAHRLMAGQRLLAAGNGGSAAEAQHLTAELVGRFDGERRAFSAIALHADTSSLTAIGNDYGFDQVFARQVAGHGRPGDVLMLLSTSGSSRNLLLAVEEARRLAVTTWAITGASPNPLTSLVDEYIALPGPSANVQEAQLVAVHAMCRSYDQAVAEADAGAR